MTKNTITWKRVKSATIERLVWSVATVEGVRVIKCTQERQRQDKGGDLTWRTVQSSFYFGGKQQEDSPTFKSEAELVAACKAKVVAEYQ